MIYKHSPEQSMWSAYATEDYRSFAGWITGRVREHKNANGTVSTRTSFDVTYENRDESLFIGNRPTLEQAKELLESTYLHKNEIG